MLRINKILVARDYSSVSNRALARALDLAARTGASLHLLHAEVLHHVENREQDRPEPTTGFDSIRDELRQSGTVPSHALDRVSVTGAVRRDVSPAPAILQYAADEDIDLIALGTHGRRGPSRVLLGSVAEEVVRHADRPVLSVRGEKNGEQPTRLPALERILVPVDFSKYSRQALEAAREWAALYDAQIDVLHVIEETLHPAFYVGGVQSIYDAQPNIEEKTLEKMKTFIDSAQGPDVDIERYVMPGTAPSAIADFVDDHEVDLVSMSTHGHTGVDRFLMGSVAEKVVRHVACPVLTVKAFGHSLLDRDATADGTDAKA